MPLPIASSPATAFAFSLVLAGAVVVLSLVPLAAGRASATFTLADLAAPRAMFERLPPWGQRASWAHQNAFEAFTLHAPACLLCLVSGVDTPLAVIAAWAHPLLRVAYLGVYVANLPALRSLCWIGGLLATAILYGEGLRAVLAAG
jgi:uncharacterized MAPEG superfamily protein